MTTRIAMWSGPRNLSTAMMRAFENRADCSVMDEPFYAAYLRETGLEHPMRNEILESGQTDPASVANSCATTAQCPISYQKHMTQHMLHNWLDGWSEHVHHAFLIRAPERVLASYSQKRETVTLEDIGFLQQAQIFERIKAETGTTPPVIEAEDVRQNPEKILTELCDRLEIPFDPAMLNWPAGPRTSDGIWASHWYHAVEKSTGFSPPPDDALPKLDARHQAIADAARPAYEVLQCQKISA